MSAIDRLKKGPEDWNNVQGAYTDYDFYSNEMLWWDAITPHDTSFPFKVGLITN
jgi:hypothetical protein